MKTLLPLAVAALGVPPLAAADGDGVQFLADLARGLPAAQSKSVIKISTDRGWLSHLSFRAIENVEASVPRAARGKAVGTITFDGTRYALRVPRQPAAKRFTLLHHGFILVRFRPRNPTPLTVIAPAHTQSLTIRFYGTGLGLLGASRPCPAAPSMGVYAIRAAAPPARAESTSHC